MNILYTEQITERYYPAGIGIVLILVVIVFIIGLYLADQNRPYIDGAIMIISFIFMFAGLWFCIRNVYKGNNLYYVTVDNTDKLNSYEIVEQKGDIYIIQDKENSNEKIHK